MLSIQAHSADHTPLESTSMGRQEYWNWFVASGGTLIDGLSIFSLGVAMPLITSRFSLSALMVGLIGSALVLGAVFGAVIGGPAADRFGRKPAFLIDMTIITVGALISALADAPQWVLLGQFIVGVGIGIDFPVSSSYVSETMPKQVRSPMVVATIALQSVGMLLGAAVAIAILWQRSSTSDWRLIVGATATVAFLFLLLRFWLPESPRWLRQHEQGKTVTGGAAAASPGPGFAVLFSRPYRTRTMLVSLPVSHGRRYLWRRSVHTGDPRRHPLFVQDQRAFGGRICRRSRQWRHRSFSALRVPRRIVGGTAFRPDPYAGHRFCRHDPWHADSRSPGTGSRWCGGARMARVRGLHFVQPGHERWTERAHFRPSARAIPYQNSCFRRRLCRGRGQGWGDVGNLRASASKGARRRRGGAGHDGHRQRSGGGCNCHAGARGWRNSRRSKH